MRRQIIIISVLCLLLCGCGESSSAAPVKYDSVEAVNTGANELYESQRYSEALIKYSEAMRQNPVDMDAILGAARCQIALENYSLAETNLLAAFRLDPEEEEIYDLYFKIGEKSENSGYVENAIRLAKEHHIESILEKIPEPPVFDHEDGKYNEKFEVAITAAGTEIFVTEISDTISSYQYSGPISIKRGTTSLEAYCVKDNIPSETVQVTYDCDYPPEEVTFADPVIEKIVRSVLEKDTGPVTDIDCESITRIDQDELRSAGMDWQEYQKISVNSLEDFRYFPNLESLDLERLGNIRDFSPLSTCRKLYNLYISESGLSDISFVSEIPNLRAVGLYENNISDLSPLAECEHLSSISVQRNPVSDLSVLKDKDINSLSFSLQYIDDFSVLLNWPNLRSLSMHGCGGRDLSVIKNLTNLEYLYLYADDSGLSDSEKKPLKDISFLSDMINLKRLSLHGLADYSQIGEIWKLTNLTSLSVYTMDYEGMPSDVLQELQKSLPNCEINY